MQLRESTRRYILLGMVTFIILGVIVAKAMAKSQDEQFATEDLLYQQASQLASEGNFEEASSYINELLKRQPDSEAVNYLGGLIFANKGDMKKSSVLFQKTLDINPHKVDDPMFMLQFGEALFNVKRYEDAKIVLVHCQESSWSPEDYPNYQTRVENLLKSIEENTK